MQCNKVFGQRTLLKSEIFIAHRAKIIVFIKRLSTCLIAMAISRLIKLFKKAEIKYVVDFNFIFSYIEIFFNILNFLGENWRTNQNFIAHVLYWTDNLTL